MYRHVTTCIDRSIIRHSKSTKRRQFHARIARKETSGDDSAKKRVSLCAECESASIKRDSIRFELTKEEEGKSLKTDGASSKFRRGFPGAINEGSNK